MRKQSLLWGGIAFAVVAAGIAWAGITVLSGSDEPAANADGTGLRVDVVAPKEPEVANSGGQLGVGELANGYDHTEAMARIHPAEETGEDIGTSWNDDNWNYSDGTGPAPSSTPGKDAMDEKQPLPVEKTIKVTKVPNDYEG
ncbi:hypothetical protein [Brevundimonas sp.]|uniref:hypothetical protein n=1 Tax=Brevundimonas sp. TaxID=1871086 RepID=UPI002FC9C78D